MSNPIQILERYWNYTSFKPQQKDIIDAVINGEDVLALLPTGGGKSVCYQIPALVKEGLCIVISPLIALIKNQVDDLTQKGIKAIALTSGISYHDLDTLLDNCIYGNYKFLYLSPERLQNNLVQERIKQMNINLIAVDEAHCISQWGNDFRPAYKNINLLREIQPSANIIALTATATLKVSDDIVKELDFINPKLFKKSFERPNISYSIKDEEDKYFATLNVLKRNKKPSIVYVRTRKLAVTFNEYLNNNGVESTFYHGGLANEIKNERLKDWLTNKTQVVVATSAFGMGIDKPDVQTVIHINLPESLESYYQECGRAGRNGEESFAYLFKNKSDIDILKNQFLSVIPKVKFIKTVYKKLCAYFQIAYGEGELITHNFQFADFCKTYILNTTITYNAIKLLDSNSVLSLSSNFKNKTKLKIIVSNSELFSYLNNNNSISILTKVLLRTYGGLFETETNINIDKIATKASVSNTKIIDALKQLKKDTIISLSLVKTDAEITFLVPREDDYTINKVASIIEQQNTTKIKQVNAVIKYIENTSVCKNQQLLSYFGEAKKEFCGKCSVCTSTIDNSKTNVKAISERIIFQLKKTNQTSRELAKNLEIENELITLVLQNLLENNTIEISNTNTYKLKHI